MTAFLPPTSLCVLALCFGDAGTLAKDISFWGGSALMVDDRIIAIDMSRTQVTDRFVDSLSGVAASIERLDLSLTKISDKCMPSVGALRSLKELRIGSNNLTGKCIPFINQLKALQTLDLSLIDIVDEDIARISLPKLRSLNLNSTKIVGFGLKALEDAPCLEELFLGNTNIKDNALASLPKLRTLRTLDLASTRVEKGTITSINKLPLTYLGLRGCLKLKDDDFSEIAGLVRLKELCLDSTSVSDKDLVFMRRMPNLEVISLSNTPISNEAINILEQMPTLREVRLWSCNVSETRLREFARKRPRVTITPSIDE